jgi:hypothetical protein
MRDEAKVGAHVATEISRIGSTTYLGEGNGAFVPPRSENKNELRH